MYIVLTVLGDLSPQPGGSGKDKKPATQRPGPVAPTALAAARHTVPLPAPFDAVGRAASGRFLLLRIPSSGALAVFDPVEAKVVKVVPLGEKNALFAGGAGKLFVYRPKAKELDRYDLVTWEKEDTAKKPDALAAVDHLVVGVGTDAPVLAVAAGSPAEVAVIDPTPSAWALHPTREWSLSDSPRNVRPSADGTLVGVTSRDAANPDGRFLRFAPPKAFTRSTLPSGRAASLGHLAPSPDGRFVYSARGAFDRDGAIAVPPGGDFFYTLPAAHGSDLFLSVGVGGTEKLEDPLRLHGAGQRPPAAVLAGVALPAGLSADDAAEVPMDLRIHLWPAAGLLAVLPTSNDAIDLYKIDVPGLLAKSGREYLMFGSEPPTSAARGARLMYETKVWASAAADVSFEVTGPEGMAMRGPVLMWTVPAAGDEKDVGVKLRAKLPDGRSAEQSFRVLLVDSPPAP